MKSYVKIAAGMLASLSLLSACSGSLVNLTYTDGKMQNKRLHLAYTPAPTTYQPVSIGEAYGYYKKSDLTLYEIVGLDPEDWLTQEYVGSATTLFYSDDITLPTLTELQATKVLVCSNEEITYVVATIDEQEIIDALIDVFENGENCDWPLVDALCTYDMKFYSEELYPHIYYNLIYGEFPEGKFLYDRNTKHCVNIGTILDTEISSEA